MIKEIRKIENEKALLEYLYKRLMLGNTDSIKEEEYLNFISLLEERINSSSLERIEFERESFSSIFEKVLNILNPSLEVTPLIYSDTKGIVPTYELTKISYSDYRMFEGIRENFIIGKLIEEITPKIELSTYDWIKFDSIEASQKISSFYIQELAQRYMKEMVTLGCFPIKDMDVDKYIFEQDLGKFFNSPGTKDTFIKAYIHSTKIISEMLDGLKNNEKVIFSNNPTKVLAYANYLKMILPEELKFLTRYNHKPYALNNPEIDITCSGSHVSYESVTCVSFDETGEWSDAYERESGTIDEECVKVMQKRLGNRNHY